MNKLHKYENIITKYATTVDTLEDLAEQLNYSEIELEISTCIELHKSVNAIIEYIVTELDLTPNDLNEVLAGEATESLEIYHIGNYQYVTIFE